MPVAADLAATLNAVTELLTTEELINLEPVDRRTGELRGHRQPVADR